jgi:hypothetical protein
MADFAGTITLTAYVAPFMGHAGTACFTITLSSSPYTGGNLNLTGVADRFTSVTPASFRAITFNVGAASAAYIINWVPAAQPTWANLGTLRLFSNSTTEVSGTVTFTITATATVLNASLL